MSGVAPPRASIARSNSTSLAEEFPPAEERPACVTRIEARAANGMAASMTTTSTELAWSPFEGGGAEAGREIGASGLYAWV